MTNSDLAILVLLILAYPVLLGIRRRREAIRYFLRRLALAYVTAFLVFVVAVQYRYGQQEALVVAGIAGLVVASLARKRARYIRRSERRRAIARFELSTGEKYNPRLHELDHDVPFSRGGSSTEDNLRVLVKAANRKKGAKTPWWDPLG